MAFHVGLLSWWISNCFDFVGLFFWLVIVGICVVVGWWLFGWVSVMVVLMSGFGSGWVGIGYWVLVVGRFGGSLFLCHSGGY